jgi:hypothetical protein
MLPEGSPTIADIDRLRLEAKQVRMNSQGWPDNYIATIVNMVEREPYFLQGPFGPRIREQIDTLTRPRDEDNADDKYESWDTVNAVFIWLKKALEFREEWRVSDVQRRKEAARKRGQNARALREEAERAARGPPAPAPAPQPAGPPLASAPPGDGGRRRKTRRGRKSRRKSLRQRK